MEIIKMIIFETELKNKVKFSIEEFISEVRGMINFAFNEKGYSFHELTPSMIAEDITGTVEKNTIPEEGMAIIRKELSNFKTSCEFQVGQDLQLSKIKTYLENEIDKITLELTNVPRGNALNNSMFLQAQTRLSTLNEILIQFKTNKK